MRRWPTATMILELLEAFQKPELVADANSRRRVWRCKSLNHILRRLRVNDHFANISGHQFLWLTSYPISIQTVINFEPRCQFYRKMNIALVPVLVENAAEWPPLTVRSSEDKMVGSGV